jgi:uncharacterized protein (UPF0332 family)
VVTIIDLQRCLRDGRIIRVTPSVPMIEKELDAAQFDLETAEGSLSRDDAKWASVQAYYSMFHSAKALVLWKGYREKNHWCLLIALRELLVRTGELDEELADDLELSMGVRHGADYALEYDMTTANRVVVKAEGMLEATRALLTRGGVIITSDEEDEDR